MDSSSDTINLLVHFCTVMVTLLSSTCNCEGHAGRMPSANTGNLAQTLVSLSRQLLCMPTRSNAWSNKKKQSINNKNRHLWVCRLLLEYVSVGRQHDYFVREIQKQNIMCLHHVDFYVSQNNPFASCVRYTHDIK